jgi:hypothetical protein
MGMTISQIMNSTPKTRRDKAKQVAILGIKIKTNLDGMPMVVAKTRSTQKNTGKEIKPSEATHYVTTIEVYPKKEVIVSCSCDDFLYTWEVALVKKGAARVEFSNGKKPTDRNPAMTPGCCGHTYALADHLISKGKL